MSEKINGKIEQYVIIQSVIRSVAVCLFLMLLGGGMNWILGENGVNIVFLDQFLILSIGMGNTFNMEGFLLGKAHVFTSSRKKIFRNCMYSGLVSSVVYALWRTFCQSVFYTQYVQEFSEDEAEALVLTRVPAPELFICNFILVLTVCVVLLWRFGSGREGFLSIGMDMKGYSEQMQYLSTMRKKRRSIPGKIGRLAYGLVEFILIVTVMVCSTYLYYFQLQSGMPGRMGVYGGILVIGVIFFLLAKRRFRPEYM